MKITSSEAYSILGIVGNAVLSKTGALTICFYMKQPEVYSLDPDGFEKRHKEMFHAFKYMNESTYIHKQDIFLRRHYDSQLIAGDSFIQRSERKHFNKREYLEHHCVLAFSLTNLESLNEAYIKNPLSYRDELTKSDKEKITTFIESVESAKSVIQSIYKTSLLQLNEADIKEYIWQYVTGFYNDNGIRDIHGENHIVIGGKNAMFFSLNDINQLPDYLDVYVKDVSLPEASEKLYCSPLEMLGVHLRCTHVINQIWNFENSNFTKDELNGKIKLFKDHGSFDKENEHIYKHLEELQEEMMTENNILCRTHFNLMILEEGDKFEKSVEQVKSILDGAAFKYYIPSHEGLEEIYLGSVLSRCNKLPDDFYFLTDLHSSLLLNINYSTYKSDSEGLFFNDRLFNIPYKLDLWDKEKKRMPARNMIIVAGTGGGKSVITENIIQQRIELNYKQIVVEFGKSFYQLTQLYPERSLHIDYDGTKPLGINPFVIEGDMPETEKLENLTNLVLRFWRKKDALDNINQRVSVSKLVKSYYLDTKVNRSFISFYNYIKENINRLLKDLEIESEYFDYKSFIHVCSQFLPGGLYENICKESDLGAQIKDKDFVVFELTKIKKDPFLVSVLMSILDDAIESNLLDRSTYGFLLFDEYAESQYLENNSNGNDIHSTVSFCFQKVRKENSSVGVVVQDLGQLREGSLTNGIIANTHILGVLPTSESVYDTVIEKFKIKNKSQVNLMKSIRNDFQSNRKYSEIFFRLGELYTTVVRLELSPEKLLAFQTDGSVWSSLQEDYKKNPNLEDVIINKLKNTTHETQDHSIRL